MRRNLMSAPRYQEGDWFAVPLDDRKFATGIIARIGTGRVLLGYFFGLVNDQYPSLAPGENLKSSDAILVGKFSYLGLADGSWPITGHSPGWNREDWPMPIFIRYEELTGRSFQVEYSESNLSRALRETLIPAGTLEQGPKDGLMGAGFVERVLSRLTA